MHILDGKTLANDIVNELKQKISAGNFSRPPGLATILVGDDKASALYVSNKQKKALEVGIKSFHYHLSATTKQEELKDLIRRMNSNNEVDGILVQLPLPRHISESLIIDTMDPNKDADGIHAQNLGLLFRGDARVLPCTPRGILHLIKSVNFSIANKHAVIVGRSNIVGKPVAHLLLQENATVTICHSHTLNLASITRQADILVAAVGRAKFITRDHVRKGAFVVDVGINRDENNKVCGDVDFDHVKDIASFITPVPFGVGPLTIAMLLSNTFINFIRNADDREQDRSLR